VVGGGNWGKYYVDLREKWVAGPRESLARMVLVKRDGEGSRSVV
jgi:hypothetical protein